jgi:SET domain-containing protein
VEKMPPLQKELIEHFGTLSKRSGKYVFSIDDSRFTNHSSKNDNQKVVLLPGDIEFSGVAKRDIKAGEEILVNYQDFDAVDAESDEPYLNN